MFGSIVIPQCEAWQATGYTKHKTPIRLVAYNGSGFDFSFILSWLLTESPHDELQVRLTMKGSTVVSLRVEYTHGTQTKVCLETWDPYLILSTSLDDAHASFCPDKHALMSKDCFPHLWIKKVSAETAFASPDEVQLDIKTAFPSKMWSTVQQRMTAGTLKAGRAEGSVYFSPLRELISYATKDVEMLEDVTESLSLTVWNDVFPNENIPVFKFATASSLGYHATIFYMEDKHKVKPKPTDRDQRTIQSMLYRLSLRLDQKVREAVYGGRTLNRALLYISSQYERILAKHKAGTLTEQDYLDLKDALFYIDAVGMYHSIAMTRDFPFGQHIELVQRANVEHFFEQFLKNPDSTEFPMFLMTLDVIPNPHDVESALPCRGENGRLLWNNEPKIQQTYTSVHLQLALRRGYMILNPTWVLCWGQRDEVTNVWTGNRAQLFKESCKRWEAMRLKGGAVKVAAKLIANSGPFGGMLKRDFFTETQSYVTTAEETVCPNVKEYTERHRDARYTCKYEAGFMRDDGGAVLMTKWESKPDSDTFTCGRFSPIGAFILAYAHELIDRTIEQLVGNNRRNGHIICQPHNGDTDSIIIHMKHFGPEKGLDFHTTRLGAFNDDLSKLYGKPKIIKFTIDGIPMFCKILRMPDPAKKFYGYIVLTPDGRLINTETIKSKGISSGAANLIMTGKRLREIEEEVKFDHKKAKTGTYEERKTERAKMNAYYESQPMISKLTEDDLVMAIKHPENDGIVAVSRRMKRHGATPSATSLREGYGPFTIENVTQKRHVLKGGAKFPPERVQIDTPEDPTTMWSVPKGWIKKTPDCGCHNCVTDRYLGNV